MPREGHDHALLLQGQALFISIHVPREGHDDACAAQAARDYYFNPRAPRGARRVAPNDKIVNQLISIHVPREGHDPPRPRRRHRDNISIHVPREGHDSHFNMRFYERIYISIHVPREGHDPGGVPRHRRKAFISIHVPREGHDATAFISLLLIALFQSTCPARGTTSCRCSRSFTRRDFNPRAPRGARLEAVKDIERKAWISIHVPREGHDDSVRPSRSHRCAFQSTCPARGTTRHFSLRCTPAEFQSTCPARGTTVSQQERGLPQAISIHVPREGHDRRGRDVPGAQPHFNPRAPRGARLQKDVGGEGLTYFNPRAPRGARLQCVKMCVILFLFQSTCPARGTTPCLPSGARTRAISIHVPREGHDRPALMRSPPPTHFNPRAPRGARLLPDGSALTPEDFNPRAPRGARHYMCYYICVRRDFNPRAPRGARPPSGR